MLTQKQKHLYWREWANVRRADPTADRHELHARALGKPKSSTHFTNADLDKVLAVFRAASRPADLTGQVRQIEQPRTRLLWRISQQLKQLAALGIDHPIAYARALAKDKYSTQFFEDLSALSPELNEPDHNTSELEMLRNTLERCIGNLRRKKGWTQHDLNLAAGLPCDCATICGLSSPRPRTSVLRSPSPEPEPELATNEPF